MHKIDIQQLQPVDSKLIPKKTMISVFIILLGASLVIMIGFAAWQQIEIKKLKTQLTKQQQLQQTQAKLMEQQDEKKQLNQNLPTPTTISNNRNKSSETISTNLEKQKKYISYHLGVSFLYLELDVDQQIMIKEENNTIYLYHEETSYKYGQFIEVFTKNKNESLAETIEKQFLANKDQDRCVVEVNPATNHPTGFMQAEICYPKGRFDNLALLWKEVEYCSVDYARTNGIRYFLYNINYPEKFAFLSIGQYAIPADENSGWQDTVKFF